MMPSAVHPFWNKAALVMTAVGFGTYNLIVWMDADCLIVDHNVDLRDSPTNYCFLGVSYVADAMGHERYVLAGCYYIKPHHPLAESFLQKIWSRRNEWNDEWVFNRTLEENAIYSNATSYLTSYWHAHAQFHNINDAAVVGFHNQGDEKHRLMRMMDIAGERGLVKYESAHAQIKTRPMMPLF